MYITRKRQTFFWCGVLLVGIIISMIGFDYMDEVDFAALPSQPSATPTGQLSLIIKVNERILEVHQDGQFFKKYRIAVGKSETPTPIGEWKIVWKDYNWGTGFGTRWMGLNVPWGIYGIHGTNKPWSIGQFASHGCIRMRNKDAEELFEWVNINTPVRIEGRKIKVQRQLKHKTMGSDVVALQMKLKELGYLSTQERADGIFGRATDEAVKRFQNERGWPEDGVVNKQLLDILGL
ncbi:hypothetical protein AXX12_15865 [Anaerosporomusa subterranea]|uniref:L,D-TPase catalytic domain-containing protein n=1 Tax=Anaerosporomusa subterranea TaxID=1794912 RepID=A0A154BMC0_ANASB|nr:L,D-transpeptidase family protein [Anaerosporomusa subterranea]KYZ75051.1 hypothetical protein AXX12_15865 [Anaerosporomusa subterranea]